MYLRGGVLQIPHAAPLLHCVQQFPCLLRNPGEPKFLSSKGIVRTDEGVPQITPSSHHPITPSLHHSITPCFVRTSAPSPFPCPP